MLKEKQLDIYQMHSANSDDDEKLNEDEKDAITKFTDEFITCSLNPATVHETKDIGKIIVEIAEKVNCHHCTKKCDTYCDKCKYGYPRFPLKDTIVIDKKEFSDVPENDSTTQEERSSKNYCKVLSDIEDVLKDKERMSHIINSCPKGETKNEYDKNRSKRIDALLEMSGNITYKDYIMAIKKTRKHGSTVMLKRDVDEIYVNNYNPEWLIAWNANLDIQPVLD